MHTWKNGESIYCKSGRFRTKWQILPYYNRKNATSHEFDKWMLQLSRLIRITAHYELYFGAYGIVRKTLKSCKKINRGNTAMQYVVGEDGKSLVVQHVNRRLWNRRIARLCEKNRCCGSRWRHKSAAQLLARSKLAQLAWTMLTRWVLRKLEPSCWRQAT